MLKASDVPGPSSKIVSVCRVARANSRSRCSSSARRANRSRNQPNQHNAADHAVNGTNAVRE